MRSPMTSSRRTSIEIEDDSLVPKPPSVDSMLRMKLKVLPASLYLTRTTKQNMFRELLIFIMFTLLLITLYLPRSFIYSQQEQFSALEEWFLEEPMPNLYYRKTFKEISNRQDVADWCTNAMLTSLFQGQSHNISFRDDDNSTSYVQNTHDVCYFYYVIGAIQFRQVRSRAAQCTDLTNRRGDCFSYFNIDWQQVAPLRLSNTTVLEYHRHSLSSLWSSPKSAVAEVGDTYGTGGLIVEFPLTDLVSVNNSITRLFEANWLGTPSRVMAVHFNLLNPHTNFVTECVFQFEFFPTGRTSIHSWFNSLPLTAMAAYIPSEVKSAGNIDRDTTLLYTHAGFLLAATFLFMLEELAMLHRKGIAAYFTSFWHIVDFSIILVTGLSTSRYTWFFADMEVALKNLLEYHNRGAYYDLSELVDAYRLTASLSSWLLGIAVIKCLKYINLVATGPIGLLLRTLSKGRWYFLSYVFILFVLLLAFAVTGHVAFGHDMAQFSALGPATNECFRMILGAFHHQEMKIANNTVASPYFWLFMIVVYLIFINIFIAVLSEFFNQARVEIEREMKALDEIDVSIDLASRLSSLKRGLVLGAVLPQQRVLLKPGDLVDLRSEELFEKLTEPQQHIVYIPLTSHSQSHKYLLRLIPDGALISIEDVNGTCKLRVVDARHRTESVLCEMIDTEERSIMRRITVHLPAKVYVYYFATLVADYCKAHLFSTSKTVVSNEELLAIFQEALESDPNRCFRFDELTYELRFNMRTRRSLDSQSISWMTTRLSRKVKAEEHGTDQVLQNEVLRIFQYLRHFLVPMDQRELEGHNYEPKCIDTSRVQLRPDVTDLAEMLAENTHDVWASSRLKQGWTYGEVLDDKNKTTPNMVPYCKLSESEKDMDRRTAMETLKAMVALDYDITAMEEQAMARKIVYSDLRWHLVNRATPAVMSNEVKSMDEAISAASKESEVYIPRPVDTTDITLTPDLTALAELLAENTHEVWSKGRLAEGWQYGLVRDSVKRTNPCLVPYIFLSETEKQYDRDTSLSTLKAITALGYRIVPKIPASMSRSRRSELLRETMRKAAASPSLNDS